MKESTLYEPVKRFLLRSGCSDVYAEVGNYDVLGLHGTVNFIVEMKTSLNFKVIDQALIALKSAQYVYIAVPQRKGQVPKSVQLLLKQYRIGLLYVDGQEVTVMVPARYSRTATKNNGHLTIRNCIRPYQDELIGGVKSGEKKTDYSVTIDAIRSFLRYSRRGRWTTVEQILDCCETHYANPRPSVMATLRAEWNKDWVETRKVGRKIEFRYKGDGDSDETTGRRQRTISG